MKKAGVILVIIGTIMWLLVPVVPFLPIKTGTKIIVGSLLTINGEVLFWAGSIMAGKELIKKFLNPKKWFKKKDNLEKGEKE